MSFLPLFLAPIFGVLTALLTKVKKERRRMDLIKGTYCALGALLIVLSACQKDDFRDRRVDIPEFSFPSTVQFEHDLSAYDLFQGAPARLIPSADVELLELSSVLFTDHAHKQRLVKIPEGTQLTRSADNTIDFPDGTILVKTFYYYLDERDTSKGKNIIETRLLIRKNGKWNAATYMWNESQTDASLTTSGSTKLISWNDHLGQNRSVEYRIPTENDCMACHQTSSSISPLGPTLLNLNRPVVRHGVITNQLHHLQVIGLMDNFDVTQVPKMVDYMDKTADLDERARAYLAMNCAHCHNPNGWRIPAEKDLDLRYETPFEGTGIHAGKERIKRNLLNQDMPFIGTTTLDVEGVALILEYLDTL